jgi:hypothetical protein
MFMQPIIRKRRAVEAAARSRVQSVSATNLPQRSLSRLWKQNKEEVMIRSGLLALACNLVMTIIGLIAVCEEELVL